MKFKAQKETIGYLLIQIAKLRRNQSNNLLAEAGIHTGQDALLYYLDIENGQTMTALVKKLQVQYATLSNMADRMEAAGLITREKHESDKRVSRLFISPKGKTVLAKIKTVWQQLESQTASGLSHSEQETLVELLKKVLINLKDNDLITI